MGELAQERFTAPTDERVAVRQHLHVALGNGEQLIGGGEYAYQGGSHVVLIEFEHDPAGLLVHLRASAIIENGNGAIGLAPSVVCPGGPGTRAHFEVAVLAAQAPYDLARVAVDLVDGE